MHLEDHVGLFDAGLYGLTVIVELKPGWQGKRLTIIAVGNEGAVLQPIRGVETLQGHGQWVRAIADALLTPGSHLCVLAPLESIWYWVAPWP